MLVVGWSSPLHGESTAGDVLSAEAVCARLAAERVAFDTAWSPAMHRAYGPRGGLLLDDAVARAADYTHLVWACGPLTGRQVQELHEAFAHCRRLAVGVSVLDPADPAVTGFDVVVPRDAPGAPPQRDLAAAAPVPPLPLLGVFLTHGQGEYGAARRHEEVSAALGGWLAEQRCARLVLETRLDPRDWRLPATAEEVVAAVARTDAVVTTRLHGLVLALRAGVPAIAVDPVAGGAKVSAQARAWGWPALVGAQELLAGPGVLDEHLAWCLSGAGRAEAARCRDEAPGAGAAQLEALVAALRG
ncbi:polysaccharide pyruvyl transferase family protein [Kineococcus glutinatus]|uniref:Polysaccharide pyruvyl transferase family protein n=1 Tax=Kineococcus glutinatus TaxID=1070872 RepID=A0ABP9I7G4_9ACTN